jgi:membrane-associated phospholipid phosphatase
LATSCSGKSPDVPLTEPDVSLTGGVATRERRGRLDPDARGGLRLTLAAVAALLLALPFTLLLLLVVDHWAPLQELDLRLDERLNSFAADHSGYVSFLKGVSFVGAPAVFQLVAMLVAGLLLWRRQPRLAAWLALSVLGGGLLSTVVKAAVGRERPLLPHPVAHAVSASFPSGHALGRLVGVGALLLVGLPSVRRSLRRPLVVLGVLVVLLIGFSRLGLGVHYLSDVLGGWVLGAGWLAATTAAFAAWRRDRGGRQRPLAEGLEPAVPEQA